MKIIRNHLLNGKHQKPILTDAYYNPNKQPKPIVILCHGYKGFKDWGSWDLMAKTFVENGFFFVKFNFSHNGGTVEQPIDFPDLNAFGNNNFIKELDDLETVIDYIHNNSAFEKEIDTTKTTLIGHSRGGGIVLIKAQEDARVTSVVTLAGVSDFGARFPKKEILAHWKKEGVVYIENSRTKQQMPHFYQFYENFKANKKRLTIKNSVEKLQIPYLILHGSKDPTVLLEEAKRLQLWSPNNTLEIIENADHGFGSKHPWNKPNLPEHLQKAIQKIIEFL